MTNYKVEFLFKDSSDMILHISVEHVEAESYDEACEYAEELMESQCAQDFLVTINTTLF